MAPFSHCAFLHQGVVMPPTNCRGMYLILIFAHTFCFAKFRELYFMKIDFRVSWTKRSKSVFNFAIFAIA